jgi:hypothetical protein
MILPVSQNMYVECGECVVNNRLQWFLKAVLGGTGTEQKQNRAAKPPKISVRMSVSGIRFLTWIFQI